MTQTLCLVQARSQTFRLRRSGYAVCLCCPSLVVRRSAVRFVLKYVDVLGHGQCLRGGFASLLVELREALEQSELTSPQVLVGYPVSSPAQLGLADAAPASSGRTRLRSRRAGLTPTMGTTPSVTADTAVLDMEGAAVKVEKVESLDPVAVRVAAPSAAPLAAEPCSERADGSSSPPGENFLLTHSSRVSEPSEVHAAECPRNRIFGSFVADTKNPKSVRQLSCQPDEFSHRSEVLISGSGGLEFCRRSCPLLSSCT